MKLRRCNGSKLLVTPHKGGLKNAGQDKIEPCPGCPDCFDLSAASARIGEYLTVRRRSPPPGHKTAAWFIYTDEGNYLLGDVKWHPPWRKYTFQPEENTVFEQDCLADIVAFLGRVNEHQREARR
jgi:hypothetical protein